MADENINLTDTNQTTNEPSTNAVSDISQPSEQNPQNEPQNTNVDIEKLIQKAVDRATNKLGNENKKLRDQIETIKKEKLSDDEIKRLELADKEADIADREAKLAEKENRLFAIKAIKEAGLDDGGSNALELVEFVLSDNEETTKAKTKVFADLVKKMVAAKVDETFKSKGRNPEQSGTTEQRPANNIAATLGKKSAETHEAANKVFDHYLRR